MTYFASDLHGEYELFLSLLEKINFSDKDKMYVCGDIIEKGDGSLKLLNLISSMKNIHCILGNHDLNFLKYYHTIMEKSPTDFDIVLKSLREFFFNEDGVLTWDMVDYLEFLPLYIETEDFICVHAGVPIDENGYLKNLDNVTKEEFLFDRRFKGSNIIHKSQKSMQSQSQQFRQRHR
ncbi:MAG: metallophosphoesterase [Clostridia bacterium]|nr:metallophosphoesterase [Clostridia bacterium]